MIFIKIFLELRYTCVNALVCEMNSWELELKATTNVLLSVAAAFSAITIAIYLDNRTAIAYLNRCGDTSSRALGDSIGCHQLV